VKHHVTSCCGESGARLVVAVESGSAGPADAVHHRIARSLGIPLGAVQVHEVGGLPRLSNGKRDLAAVRALADEAGRDAAEDGERRPPCSTAPDPTQALVELYAGLLGRPDATAASTFVELGGDSLSYVEMSVRLEELLGTLPLGWHTMTIADLTGAATTRSGPGRATETSVLLRAVSIVLIVATHIKLVHLLGGAHLLLAVAGFNFARFQLDAAVTGRVRRQLRSAARIAVPSVAFIAGAAALTSSHYGLKDILLLNGVLGRTSAGRFWFIETLLYLVLALGAVMAVPAVRRAERRRPFAFAMVLVVAGLATRYGLVGGAPPGARIYSAHVVLWLFALGWAAARARCRRDRVVVTVVALASVPGFFGDWSREGIVIAGFVLLIWVPTVRVSAAVARVSAVLAAASLYIYLVHWHVYPHLQQRSAVLALAASLAAGAAYWWLVGVVSEHLPRIGRRAAGRTRPDALHHVHRDAKVELSYH
jgi:hypothetical protein